MAASVTHQSTPIQMVHSGQYVILSTMTVGLLHREVPVLDWSVRTDGTREAYPIEQASLSRLFQECRMLSLFNFETVGVPTAQSLSREDVIIVSADLLTPNGLDLNEETLRKCVFVSKRFLNPAPGATFVVTSQAPMFNRLHTVPSSALEACIDQAVVAPKGTPVVLDVQEKQ